MEHTDELESDPIPDAYVDKSAYNAHQLPQPVVTTTISLDQDIFSGHGVEYHSPSASPTTVLIRHFRKLNRAQSWYEPPPNQMDKKKLREYNEKTKEHRMMQEREEFEGRYKETKLLRAIHQATYESVALIFSSTCVVTLTSITFDTQEGDWQ